MEVGRCSYFVPTTQVKINGENLTSKDYFNIGYMAGRFGINLDGDLNKNYKPNFDEKGIAHYYGHDSVGAYYFMETMEFWLEEGYSFDEVCEMIFYINYHMKGHKDIRQPKPEKKYRALFGNERYNKLIDFANYDMIASGTYEQYSKIKETLNNE